MLIGKMDPIHYQAKAKAEAKAKDNESYKIFMRKRIRYILNYLDNHSFFLQKNTLRCTTMWYHTTGMDFSKSYLASSKCTA